MVRENAQQQATDASVRRCNVCHTPIAPARLEVMPEATTCVACARKHPAKLDMRHIELSQASPINRNGFAPND